MRMTSKCSTSFRLPYPNPAHILNLGFSFTLRPIYHQTKGLNVPIG